MDYGNLDYDAAKARAKETISNYRRCMDILKGQYREGIISKEEYMNSSRKYRERITGIQQVFGSLLYWRE